MNKKNDKEDDLFCMNLLNEYLNDNDEHKHDTISLEDFAKQEGVILNNKEGDSDYEKNR